VHVSAAVQHPYISEGAKAKDSLKIVTKMKENLNAVDVFTV
jgi:hypothetical protein